MSPRSDPAVPQLAARFTAVQWRSGWRTILRCGLLAGWLIAPAALAQKAASVDEYQLKAVLIYNFSKFIEWPASAFADNSANFQICVMGRNPFGDALKSLTSRSYQTHPIVIQYPQTASEAKSCHILYIDDASKSAEWHDISRALADASILTVSNGAESAQSGSGIAFVSREGKIRWVLNLTATRKAQLKVSAKLVEIAADIIGDPAR